MTNANAIIVSYRIVSYRIVSYRIGSGIVFRALSGLFYNFIMNYYRKQGAARLAFGFFVF